VLRPYGLTPVLATHYTTQAAIAQKIQALAGRAEPQPRDVFDLSHLLARTDAAVVRGPSKRLLAVAIDNAMSIAFDTYVSNVVAFLEPVHAAIFEDRSAWDAMLDNVVSRMAALA
jgi:hypothetical protein